MKKLILTTAIILGAAAPTFADTSGNHYIEELARSDDDSARHLAAQVAVGNVAQSQGVVSTKSVSDNAHFIDELARSDDGTDRFVAEQFAKNGVKGTTFGTSTVSASFIDELQSGDDDDRFYAAQLIKSGAVVN